MAGLQVREGRALQLIAKPVLHELSDRERVWLLLPIFLASLRAVNREHHETDGM
jgi:hypothetical protein